MASERLKISLALTMGELVHVVPAGHIDACRLELTSHGFDATVSFSIDIHKARADRLVAPFSAPARIDAKLTIEGALFDPTAPPPPPLILSGLVIDKKLSEISYPEVKNNPVLVRTYTVHFRDIANVLWRQHAPLALLSDTTMAKVINAQLIEGIALTIELDDAERDRPLLCIGLEGGKTSFYDFLTWYLDSIGGVLRFDYTSGRYTLSDEKKPGVRPTPVVIGDDVAAIEVRFPEIIRRGARVLNADAATAKSVVITHPLAVTDVSQDVLVRTPIAADVDARKELETARLRQRLPELEVKFARLPPIAYWPGSSIGLHPKHFSADLHGMGKAYRVDTVSLTLDAEDTRVEDEATTRGYTMELRARWEREEDVVGRLPEFALPTYPVLVEGTIICDAGEDGDRTWMTYEDKKTSQSWYKVLVPLWNQKIKAPFLPQGAAGHFYAPAFKDSRVLLALYFDHCEILSFLDWGVDVRLPADGQGNHLLFGKNKSSQTSLKHAYVDAKPVLTLERSSNGDLELIQLQEGTLILQTKEDPSQKGEEAKFDLLALVAGAQEELAANTQGSIGELTVSFQKTKTALTSKTSESKEKTSAALEGMSGELSGKADEAKTAIDSAMNELGTKATALQGKSKAAIAELEKKLDL